MNQSYWQKTTRKKAMPAIDKDMKTDIVIIGGGLAGISLAYQLKDSPYHGNVFASMPRLYFEHLYGISIDEKSLNAIDYFAKKMLDNYSNMANVSKEEINTLEAVIEKTVEQIKGRIKEIEEELDEYER